MNAKHHARTLLVCVALTLATAAVYWSVDQGAFLNFDDPLNVTDNQFVRPGLTWRGTAWAFTAAHGSNWHPVTWLSHMTDCQFFGLRPAGHHLVNLAFHLANLLLLFGLLRKLTSAFWPCVLVAGWFGLHPLHVESVAWVAERKDVLSTFFFLLTICAYAEYGAGEKFETNPNDHIRTGKRRSAGWYWRAVLFFALGLMSKPMLVTLPLLLLLLDYWPLRRPELDAETWKLKTLWPLVFEKTPFVLLALASCAVTVWAQHKGGSIIPVEAFPIQNRIANAVVSYWRYVGKLFWPSRLAAFYPFGAPQPLWLAALAGAGLLVVTIAALRATRRPWLAVGWLWFLFTLIPVIGLVQVGQQAMADRYLYIPSIGLLLVVAFALAEVAARPPYGAPFATVFAVASVAACGVVTKKQVCFWRDSEALFRHAIAVTDGNYAAYNNLGTALEASGKLDEAIGMFQQALRIRPNSSEARNNLGSTLSEQGKLAEAEVPLAGAIKFTPAYAQAHYNLGVVYQRQGKTGAAIQEYRRALALKDDLPNAHNNLGCLLMVGGKLEDALGQFKLALRLRPDDILTLNNLGTTLTDMHRQAEAIAPLTAAIKLNPAYVEAHYNLGNAWSALEKMTEAEGEYRAAIKLQANHSLAHYKLGNVYYRQHRSDEASEQYRLAVSANPANAEAQYQLGVVLAASKRTKEAVPHYQEAVRLRPNWNEALNNLAWILATDPDATVRDGEAAVGLAARQVELTRTNDAEALDTLAAAYAEKGAFPEALATAQEAIDLATTSGRTNFAAEAGTRLQLYRSGKPCREP